MTAPAPDHVLIAALGGEGGGVLTDWIVAAPIAQRLSVQAPRSPASRSAPAPPPTTSRSCRRRQRALGGRRPVLALTPRRGEVDVVVASELLEAGRAIGDGLRHRPTARCCIASTHRVYAIVEKMAMGDGRYDSGAADQGDRARTPGAISCSTWRRSPGSAGAIDQRRDAGRARRLADVLPIPARGVRGRDPRRRQGGREPTCAASAPASRRRASGCRRARPTPASAGTAQALVAALEAEARAVCRAAAIDDRRRGRAPPRGLSGRGLRAALSRPPQGDLRGG